MDESLAKVVQRSALASPPRRNTASTKLMKRKTDTREILWVPLIHNTATISGLPRPASTGLHIPYAHYLCLLFFRSISKCRRPTYSRQPLVACLRSFRGGIPRCIINHLTSLSRQMNLFTKVVSSPGLLSSVGRRTCGGWGQSQ